MSEIEQVLEFWFGACGPDGALDRAKQKMWFSGGHKHDAAIRRQFGKLCPFLTPSLRTQS